MVDIGLLLIGESRSLMHIAAYVRATVPRVRNRLYIALTNQLVATIGIHQQSLFDVASNIYIEAGRSNQPVDVRFIIDNIKGHKLTFDDRHIDRIYVDSRHNTDDNELIEIANNDMVSHLHATFINGSPTPCLYSGVVLGGTFDRLHNGHKALLSTAALIGRQQITCGVTDDKCLADLIEPIATRIAAVVDFVSDISPSLKHKIVPIVDPFGPSIVDNDLQCIVVSKETASGGQKVNEKRRINQLPELDIIIIDLLDDETVNITSAIDETKMSSSKLRANMLGRLLKPPILTQLGADVIDCDQLAHIAYLPDTDAYRQIVETFGDDVVGDDGLIDRRRLGAKVFGNKDEMQKLNRIVWPAMEPMIRSRINESSKSIVVLDAAVLLEAGWHQMVHEIWVTFVPRDEAIRRIMERNKITEQQAIERIDAQMTNRDRIEYANVVLCSIWEYEKTAAQVEKAWTELQDRISKQSP